MAEEDHLGKSVGGYLEGGVSDERLKQSRRRNAAEGSVIMTILV